MNLHLHSILALATLALASAQAGAQQGTRRELPGESKPPRPERLVPPPPRPMIPERQQPRPEVRAGIEQLPVGGERVRITVRAIAAEPGPGAKDPRLSGVEANLETLPLRYGKYRLLAEQSFDLD